MCDAVCLARARSHDTTVQVPKKHVPALEAFRSNYAAVVKVGQQNVTLEIVINASTAEGGSSKPVPHLDTIYRSAAWVVPLGGSFVATLASPVAPAQHLPHRPTRGHGMGDEEVRVGWRQKCADVLDEIHAALAKHGATDPVVKDRQFG